MRHPTRVLIRHRSGNIRDHPQRYHINIGKRYTTGNFRKDFSSVAEKDKYYYVDGRRVSKKEFIDNWRKEGFYWIHDGDEYPVPPPNKYGMWQGKHRYSVTTKTQSGHYRIKNWKKMKDDEWKYDPELEEYELPFGDPPKFMYKRLRPKVPITPKTVVRVRVRGASWSDNPWVIKMVTEDGYVHTMDKSFKTKSEAIKFAVDWMKKHPNGV